MRTRRSGACTPRALPRRAVAWPRRCCRVGGGDQHLGALISQAECNQHHPAQTTPSASVESRSPSISTVSVTTICVNNNGNVTFNSASREYTPFALESALRGIIAPFCADVDTRASGSEHRQVRLGRPPTFEGHRAFCANWVDVGYYNQHADKLNSLPAPALPARRREADFDIVFSYGTINVRRATPAAASNGFGGTSARVGFSTATARRQLVRAAGLGHRRHAAGLSTSARGLIRNAIGSEHDGRYIFSDPQRLPHRAPTWRWATPTSRARAPGLRPGTDIDGV